MELRHTCNKIYSCKFHSHENLYLGLLWLVGSVVVRFLPSVILSEFGHKKHSCHELLLFVGKIVLPVMPLYRFTAYVV